MPSSRWWALAGILLDVAGLALIALSLEQGGPLLLGGLVCLVIGTLAVRHGFLKPAEPGAAEPLPAPEKAVRSWRIEPELRQNPPRKTRLRPLGSVVAMAWGLMFAAIAFFAWERVFSLKPPVASQDLLEQQGEEAWGAVHGKYIRQRADGGSQHYLSYNFEDAMGSEFRSSMAVPRAVYERYDEGDRMWVRYFEADPLVHYLPEVTQDPIAIRALLIAALLAIGAGVYLETRRRRHSRLVKRGEAIAGVVERVRSRGASHALEVRYTVNGNDRVIKGTERNLARKRGDTVTVLYNPRRPDEAEIYRLCLYEAVAPKL